MNYPELASDLFHGSTVGVIEIDLSKGAYKKDFGKGFYTTSSKEQAEKFVGTKAHREHLDEGYVSVFTLPDYSDLKIKRYGEPTMEWLDFVLENRKLQKPGGRDEKFDIVIGPVADDAVGLVLNQLIIGTYGDTSSIEAKETAIRLLKSSKLDNQVFFGTEKSIKNLIHKEVYRYAID
ncbi:MAG: DUF3990 domain-containing protein [Lactobacillales bacterium]|jgi:hypothetical protein|nr:DUF3990 domain-containing protein [Lactobacillales bacterium]